MQARVWIPVYSLILTLGAGLAAAQTIVRKAPAASQKKAARVWTDDDFSKPAAKADLKKAESTEGQPAKAAEAPEGKPPSKEEQIENLEREVSRTRDQFEQHSAQRDAILAELAALEKQREAAVTYEEQVAITAQIAQKRKELSVPADQASLARTRLQDLQRNKEALQNPPEEGPRDYGVSKAKAPPPPPQ